jgi:hypothetical protein
MTTTEHVQGFRFSERDGHLVLRVTTDKRARMLELEFDEVDSKRMIERGALL